LINTLVSSEIRGQLVIQHIDKLSLRRAIVRDVRLYDPFGVRVARVDTVVVNLKLSDIIKGVVSVPSITARGADITLIRGASGDPTMIEALNSRNPSPTLNRSAGLRVRINTIWLTQSKIHGEFLGLKNISATNVRARGWVEVRNGITIGLVSAQTDLERPFPFTAHIDDVSGVIHTEMIQGGITINAKARLGNERAQARIRYGLRPHAISTDTPELHLKVYANPVSTHTLFGLGYTWAEPLATRVRGVFRLDGPTSSLRLSSNLESDGGPIWLRGNIADELVELRGGSSKLRLVDFFETAPDLEVSGTGHLRIPEGEKPQVELKLEPFKFSDFTAPHLNAKMILEEDRFRIQRIDAPQIKGTLQASGHITLHGEVYLKWKADVSRLEHDPYLQKLLGPTRGSVQGEGDFGIDIKRRRMQFSGAVALTDMRYGRFASTALKIEGHGQGALNRPVSDVKLTGQGVAFANRQMEQLRFTLAGGPQRYLAQGQLQFSKTRSLDFKGTVLADKAAYTLNAERILLQVDGQAWEGQIENLRYANNRSIELTKAQLAHGAERLAIRGSQRGNQLAFIAEVQGFDLAGITTLAGVRDQPLAGQLDAQIELSGTPQKPKLSVSGAVQRARIHAISGLTISYYATYEEGQVEFDASAQSASRGQLSVAGRAEVPQRMSLSEEVFRRATFDLEFEAQNLDLQLIKEWGYKPLWMPQGLLSGKTRVHGDLQNPTIESTFAFRRLRFIGWSTVDMRGHMFYDARRFELSDMRINDLRGELLLLDLYAMTDVAAVFSEPKSLLYALSSTPWRIHAAMPARKTNELPQPLSEMVPPDLQVKANLDITHSNEQLTGQWYTEIFWDRDSQQATCAKDLHPVFLFRGEVLDSVTHATLVGKQEGRTFLRLETTAFTPLRIWLAQAEIPELPTFDLEGVVTDAKLEGMPVLCEYGTGPFTAKLKASDLFSTQPAFSADIQSNGLQLYYASDKTRQSKTFPFRVNARADASNTKTFNFAAIVTPKRGHQSISRCGARMGDAPHAQTLNCGPLSGSAEHAACVAGSMPLTWSKGQIFPEISATDRVNLEIKLYETLVEPLIALVPWMVEGDALVSGQARVVIRGMDTNLSGGISLKKGCLELVGVGAHLDDLQGEIKLRGNQAYIDRSKPLTAKDQEGRISVSGPLTFRGLELDRVRLLVEGSQFAVRSEGASLASLTGRASLNAQFLPEATDAQIEILQLQVNLPDQGKRQLQTIDKHKDIRVVGQKEIKLDIETHPYRITIDASKPITVKRSDFSVQVAGELSAVYLDPRLYVDGYIQMLKGYFEIFGKRFAIQRGSLTFDGEEDINPTVDLLATYAPRGQESNAVIVTVSGPLMDPTIDFASNNPSITERAEIIALLVSGRRATSRPIQGDEQAAAQQANSFLAGLTAGLLTVAAREEFGDIIPTIAIEGGQRGLQGGRVRAGWQLDAVIRKHLGFLDNVVLGGYVEGFVTSTAGTADPSATQGATTTQQSVVGGLLELYFPYSFVGSMMFSPPDNWGVDITWEP